MKTLKTRQTTTRGAQDMSKTKEAIDVEEMHRQLEELQREEMAAFTAAYDALCKEHGFQLMPEMILRPGAAPVCSMTAVPLK